MDKKLVVAADLAGMALKDDIVCYLKQKGYEITDVGIRKAEEPMYYGLVAAHIAQAVQRGAFTRGIVVCGTGQGVMQVCNKFRGIYCALGYSALAAKKSRIINNANMLALGGLMTTPTVARDIVDAFLETEFCQGETPERVTFLTTLRGQCDGYGQIL
nr:RpiB/LacA/LacB family sugar-phosphate isomerase [Maliibacterium massiliense]